MILSVYCVLGTVFIFYFREGFRLGGLMYTRYFNFGVKSGDIRRVFYRYIFSLGLIKERVIRKRWRRIY